MAGSLLKVLPKRIFDFGHLVVGQTQSLYLAERIDISQYNDGMAALRVHAITLTGGTISLTIHGDGYTDEDPGLIFRSTISASGSLGSTAPALVTWGATIRGNYMAIDITGNRTSAAALSATLSLDLILRTPDSSPS